MRVVESVDRSLICAVDVGTSFLKTVLFDRSGQIVAHDRHSYQIDRPSSALMEQQPEVWIFMLEEALDRIRAQGVNLDQVVAIGLSGRGGGAVFLDDCGEVLTPCWLDRRSHAAMRDLATIAGPEVERETRGLAARLLYLNRTSPDLFPRIAHALLVKDFVLYRLTGVIATDVSSGPPSGAWPQNVWSFVGFPAANLPPILPLTAIGGTLTSTMAKRLGIRSGIPVGVGAHDGVCANIGVGAVQPGQVCLTLGTHGVVRVTAKPRTDRGDDWPFASYTFLEGRRTYYCDLLRVGSAPTLVAALLAGTDSTTDGAISVHATLTAAASTVLPGSGGVTYLPFPMGEISPEHRPEARAAFTGLGIDATPGALYRAALEGTACAFRSVVEHMRTTGIGLDEIWVSGGGAENSLWIQILADVLDQSLTLVAPHESARGAAMLLATGIGWFDTIESAARVWVSPAARVDPSTNVVAYRDVYTRFRRMADAVYAGDLLVGD